VSFHLGKPVLAMLLIAAVSGAVVATREEAPRRDLSFWIFAPSHAEIYRRGSDDIPALTEQFRRAFGQSVNVSLINARALDTRLLSLMMSGATGDKVPDVVKLEIGSIGKYFRFPPDKVGLLPLDPFLDRDGLREQLLPARLAPWTRGGTVFGIPHDVHPVSITYRKDLFDAAGVDLAAATTWDQFHAACLAYQRYWAAHGHPDRAALELPRVSAGVLERLLLQRRINLVDSELQTHLSNPKVADTVLRYAEMVAGPARVGVDASPGGFNWVGDLRRGAIGAFITADWRVTYIRLHAGDDLPGKLAMMAMPVFEPGDHPTSTWGGTMAGIPRHARDPEASWRVIRFFMLSPEGLAARNRHSDILSPLRSSWNNPRLDKPDPLFGGQRVGALLVELAGQVPEFHATPFTTTSGLLLSQVLYEQATLVEQGVPRAERHSAVTRRLAEQDEYLRRIIRFTAFE
jgi:arabinosaccharide transport system substrate-binding protein